MTPETKTPIGRVWPQLAGPAFDSYAEKLKTMIGP